MDFPIPIDQFQNFLSNAKRATYAAPDNDAKVEPLVRGSHQLEFRQGALLYRDIYFGGDFFVGMETVITQGESIWGMSYAGGINDGVRPNQYPGIYDFLKAALREVPRNAPFRGPETLIEGKFSYLNRILGTVSRFSGVETISYENFPIYQLHYSGGSIKE